MANKFDRDNYPTQEPDVLVIGDRWMWRRPDLASIYDPSEYALTYEYHRDSGGGGANQFTLTATETANDYIIEIPSATTAGYTANAYIYYVFIAKTVLDAIEAVIENRASQDQMSYSIAGRSLSRMSIDDLMKFRDRYYSEYQEEIKKSRIKNKQDSGNLVKVRF
jgi:hypothetical protein